MAVDVLVVTALKLEHDAFRDAALRLSEPKIIWLDADRDQPTPYLHGTATFQDGRLLTLALARPTRMGADPTSVAATNLATKLAPKCLAMSGVCAGNPKDVSVGDVVVAELAYDYEEGKSNTAGFSADPRQQPLRESLVRFAQEIDERGFASFGQAEEDERELWFLELLSRDIDPRKHPARSRYVTDRDWPQFVRRLEAQDLISNIDSRFEITDLGKRRVSDASLYNVGSPQTLPFKVHVGPMASGASVNKTGFAWDMLEQRGLRSAIALEMEAASIANAAYRLHLRDWIVVKGVMDYADPNKEDRYKEFGARASAEVLLEILFRGPFEDAKDDDGSEGPATGETASNINDRFPSLQPTLKEAGSEWLNLFKAARDAVTQSLACSAKASSLAARTNELLINDLAEFREYVDLSEEPKGVLKSEKKSDSGRKLGSIRWSSGDEYFGELLKGRANGLGEYKIYALTKDDTPNVVNYYSGEVLNDRIGKFGTYTFGDRTTFYGEWLDDHPSFGYKTFPDEEFGYTEFLGSFASIKDPRGKTPNRWLPHGRGIGINATHRTLLVGSFSDGHPAKVVSRNL